MNERELTNQIIEYLNYTGKVFCWKVNSGMIKAETKGKTRMIRMAGAGTSDILGIIKGSGRTLCFEVKLPKKEHTLTELQEMYLVKMREYGAVTALVTSCEQALKIIEGVL